MKCIEFSKYTDAVKADRDHFYTMHFFNTDEKIVIFIKNRLMQELRNRETYNELKYILKELTTTKDLHQFKRNHLRGIYTICMFDWYISEVKEDTSESEDNSE